MTSARRAWTIAAAVVAGLGAIAVAALLWPGEPEGPVQRVTIDEPATHWADEGFVAMVPPVRLPSTSASLDDVVVWLKIPEGGVIETRERGDGSGELVLVFPPGTVADRVEERGRGERRGVIDVRGTRIGEENGEEWMHTLRRGEEPGANAPMFGYEWPRSQPEAHARATEALLAELAEVPPGSKMSEDDRAAYLERIKAKNQCTSCHVHARPANAVEGEHGVVNRGTDGSGFFTPQTVLEDELPLERYGGVDPNLRDPLIELRCPGGGEPKLEKHKKRLRAVCPEQAVPLARLDLAKALAAGDPRARRLCEARRYLYAHLDERGREHYAGAVEACSI